VTSSVVLERSILFAASRGVKPRASCLAFHVEAEDILTSGTSPNCRDSAAKKNGTYGLSKASGSNGYLSVGGLNSSTISGGFWFYTPAVADWAYTDVLQIAGTANYSIMLARSGGTAYFQIYVGTGTNLTVVNTAAWYWITWKITASGSLQMGVYDSTCTQMAGSPISEAGVGGANFTAIRYGYTANNARTSYWDDLAIDWTDATFPLTPCL